MKAFHFQFCSQENLSTCIIYFTLDFQTYFYLTLTMVTTNTTKLRLVLEFDMIIFIVYASHNVFQ